MRELTLTNPFGDMKFLEHFIVDNNDLQCGKMDA